MTAKIESAEKFLHRNGMLSMIDWAKQVKALEARDEQIRAEGKKEGIYEEGQRECHYRMELLEMIQNAALETGVASDLRTAVRILLTMREAGKVDGSQFALDIVYRLSSLPNAETARLIRAEIERRGK